jgi:hypothetical protein
VVRRRFDDLLAHIRRLKSRTTKNVAGFDPSFSRRSRTRDLRVLSQSLYPPRSAVCVCIHELSLKKLFTVVLCVFLPLSELVGSVKPLVLRQADLRASTPLSDDLFFFEIGRDRMSVWESSFEPGNFPEILHGNSYSRGTSRGSRLHPVKSRVMGFFTG